MIEQQLREALRELADEVPASRVPPLRLPSPRFRRSGARRRGALRSQPSSRWLAPLAAAMSVVAVAAGVAAVAALIRHAGAQPESLTPSPGTVPPYYVALTSVGSPYPDQLYGAGVYATATGARLALVTAPGRARSFVGVSAAANDLTFALAAEQYHSRGLPAVTFYLLRFDPASQTARLNALGRLRVPAGAMFEGFALSPNADRLAVAFEPEGTAAPGAELRILTVSTGAVRTWASSRGTVAASTVSPSLSWAGDNATLAFNWYGSRPGNPGAFVATTGVRLLDTTRPGANLVAGSRLGVRLYRVKNHPDPSGLVPDVGTLTADGTIVVAAVASRSGTTGGFAEFSAITGHLIRKLGWGPTDTSSQAGAMSALWASRSGRTLLVSSPPGHPGKLAILAGTRLRLLPWPGQVPFRAAAW